MLSRGLTIVLVTLALALPVGSAAGVQLDGTSECLGLPTDAVYNWMDGFPCCFDERTCLDACENWFQTCNDIARIAYECQTHTARESIDLMKGNVCDTQTDKADRKDCSNTAAVDLRGFRDYMDSNLRNAKSDCGDFYFDCLDYCLDE
jgi:hypothetical protein